MGYFDFTDLGDEPYLGKKITFTVTYSYCSAILPTVSPVKEYYGYFALGTAIEFSFPSENTAACATTTFVMRGNDGTTVNFDSSEVSRYTTHDPTKRHLVIGSGFFQVSDIGQYMFEIKERDDLDGSNAYYREVYLDIIGCWPDPNWYSMANDWGTFTYYIGGDDLVVEFTDWSNGYCEMNLLVEEMSTWSA